MKNKNLEEAIKNIQLIAQNGAWEKTQTHKSLMPKFFEELYEYAEAVENQDVEEMKKELSDLLLQVLFHAQIAENNQHFSLNDVASAFNEKIKSRSPEVLNGDTLSEAEQIRLWEERKAQEKNQEKLFKLNSLAPPEENLRKMILKYQNADFLESDDLRKIKELEEKILELKKQSESINDEIFQLNEKIINRKVE